MKQFNLAEIDCIFISYDEPNAEHNYADLLNKAPWVKRIHGIKGSDAAHKAAANLSETERFITVDADNIVDPKFFNLTITDTSKQLSWCGNNNINGLMYGNGGLKCWTRDYVLNMRTHEAADSDTSQVDFCWSPDYQQMSESYSTSHINTTPLQAFRAGFREGVKMTLHNGVKQELLNPKTQLVKQNYQRLLIWQNIGLDVEQGAWAIYGARLGCYMTNCTDWDYTQVRDFEYLNKLFEEKFTLDPLEQIAMLGQLLKQKLNLPVSVYDPEQSKFFKDVWNNVPRVLSKSSMSPIFNKDLPEVFDEFSYTPQPDDTGYELAWYLNRKFFNGPDIRVWTITTGDKGIKRMGYITPNLATTLDVVFISYDEINAEENWEQLKKICSRAIRVHGVKGIYNAHKEASELVATDMFYVVDGDAWVTDFDFNYTPDIFNRKYVHIFKSLNPVNGLEYGNGAIKILPKHSFNSVPGIDVTTSLGQTKLINQVVCETRFNTTPFNAWRAGFREAAKLASGIINNQLDQESHDRLKVWINVGSDTEYGTYSMEGAMMGEIYAHSKQDLNNINDYNWLLNRYKDHYK